MSAIRNPGAVLRSVCGWHRGAPRGGTLGPDGRRVLVLRRACEVLYSAAVDVYRERLYAHDPVAHRFVNLLAACAVDAREAYEAPVAPFPASVHFGLACEAARHALELPAMFSPEVRSVAAARVAQRRMP